MHIAAKWPGRLLIWAVDYRAANNPYQQPARPKLLGCRASQVLFSLLVRGMRLPLQLEGTCRDHAFDLFKEVVSWLVTFTCQDPRVRLHAFAHGMWSVSTWSHDLALLQSAKLGISAQSPPAGCPLQSVCSQTM